jgi:hypothetical protein
MPKRTLADRLAIAARRKARAEQEQAKLKLMQRKERTRRLIEIGGLAVKAGIDGLSAAALYDRFLRIADEASDPKAVALWERSGGRHFHQEDDTRVVAVAKFAGKILPDLTSQLRELGFHWNRLLIQWEGKVEWDEAKAFVEGKGGKIRQVNS